MTGCAHTRHFNYTSDDPIAEAVCAFVDSGDYRTLAIRFHDSLIGPYDSSLFGKEVNLERPPGGFYIVLRTEGTPGSGDQQSELQLAFMKRYNTAIGTLLLAGPHEESLPPNLRMKLSWCGGRQKEKGPS